MRSRIVPITTGGWLTLPAHIEHVGELVRALRRQGYRLSATGRRGALVADRLH